MVLYLHDLSKCKINIEFFWKYQIWHVNVVSVRHYFHCSPGEYSQLQQQRNICISVSVLNYCYRGFLCWFAITRSLLFCDFLAALSVWVSNDCSKESWEPIITNYQHDIHGWSDSTCYILAGKSQDSHKFCF